ncbi:MAG: S49 family peptidase, partial [bacterium]
VIMEFPDAEDLLKKIGVRYVVVKSGRYKDTGSFARGLSEEERVVLKATIDDVYQQFVESIWQGRRPQIRVAYARLHHLPPAKVSDGDAKAFLLDVADGRVMSGRQALQAGLVDELGGLDDAIQAAGRLAGIGDRPRTVNLARRREANWTDLLGTIFGGPPPEALWPRRARVSLGYLLR